MTEFFEFALGGTAWGGFWRFAGVVVLLGMVLQAVGTVAVEGFRALSRRQHAPDGGAK